MLDTIVNFGKYRDQSTSELIKDREHVSRMNKNINDSSLSQLYIRSLGAGINPEYVITNDTVIQFGKYKNQLVPELTKDEKYLL